MYFLISKLLSFIVSPIIWVFTLFVLAFMKRNEPKGKKIFIMAILCFYIFSNEFITDISFGRWEYRNEISGLVQEQIQPYEYGIVMGGMTWLNQDRHQIQFLRAGDRLYQAIWLLKNKKIKKILFTGGSGSLSTPDVNEGQNIKTWLLENDIPDSLIILESESNNTYESACLTKQKLTSLNYQDERVLLITSASHMRRSLACFKKQGINNIIPFPTDYYCSPFRLEFDHCLIPNTDTFHANTVLFHEIFGYIIYKVLGFC